MNRLKLIVLLGSTILIVAAAQFLFQDRSNWSKKVVAETETIGNEIVAALEKHKAEEGGYPPSLHHLVPKYLPSVKPPTAGNRAWHYYASRDDYILSFRSIDVKEGGPSACWKPGYSRWGHDTGFP